MFNNKYFLYKINNGKIKYYAKEKSKSNFSANIAHTFYFNDYTVAKDVAKKLNAKIKMINIPYN